MSRLLVLPYGEYMQDWPLEVADASRLNKFCDLYESDATGLDVELHFALMQLILFSLEDWLYSSKEESPVPRIERLLCRDFLLHLHTLNYWCLPEETDLENVFPPTPMVRRVWANCFQVEYGQWLREGGA